MLILTCGTAWEGDDRKGDEGGSARGRPFRFRRGGLVVAFLGLLGLHGLLTVTAP